MPRPARNIFFSPPRISTSRARKARNGCAARRRARVADQEALWQALALGDLQTISSDHAPYRFDETGKLRAGPNPNFKQVANGLPGLEVRLPLLFDAMVSKGRLGLEKFVELTATAPAKIYNLHPRKGSIAIGADADIAIWDPAREVTLSDAMMHDLTGYTPYAGRKLARLAGHGAVARTGGRRRRQADGRVRARAVSSRAPAARPPSPTGRLVADMDPKTNFGAKLL